MGKAKDYYQLSFEDVVEKEISEAEDIRELVERLKEKLGISEDCGYGE